MLTLTLPGTNLRTSAVGFGCVGLTAVSDDRRAGELLQRALDLGVTHFDVARLYGLGRAERILGSFLRGRRDHVTITTKFGLAPPPVAARNPSLVAAAKRVLRHFPPVARLARRYVAQKNVTSAFSAREAESSLHASLAALQTDYVDVLLLHEADLADARRDELLAFAEREIARGTIRVFGIGSGSDRLERDLESYPPLLKIVQLDNDVVRRQRARLTHADGRVFFTHGALRVLPRLLEAARRDPMIRERLGVDLTRPRDLGALLLQYARFDNPDGLVLFGSTQTDHIDANVEALTAPVDQEMMRRFASAVMEVVATEIAPAHPG